MKKILSLLLALTMVFALCGCGSRFLTQEEKEAIYEEVKQQKEAESTAENTEIEKPADESIADNTEASDGNGDSEQLYKLGKGFVVEDFEYLGIENNGSIRFRLKLRNKTDKDFAEYYFDVQLLDENKDIIARQTNGRQAIMAGEAAWETCSFAKSQYTIFPSYIRVVGVSTDPYNNGQMLEEIAEYPLNDSND